MQQSYNENNAQLKRLDYWSRNPLPQNQDNMLTNVLGLNQCGRLSILAFDTENLSQILCIVVQAWYYSLLRRYW